MSEREGSIELVNKIHEVNENDLEGCRNSFVDRVLYLIVNGEVENKFGNVDDICGALTFLQKDSNNIYLQILTRFISADDNVGLVMNIEEGGEEEVISYTVGVKKALEIGDMIDSNNDFLDTILMKVN